MQSNTSDNQNFEKRLNWFDATLIVAGSMIGSGIFIVSADMARHVGGAGWLLFLWIFTGVITLAAALSYGELAGMLPKAGGQFIYIEKAWGKKIGFLYGWSVFTVIQTGVIAAVAVAFAKYMAVFFPFFDVNNKVFQLGIKVTGADILAVFSILLLTYINTNGIKSGKLIQVFFTSTKLLALLALIVLGIAIGWGSEAFNANFSDPWALFSMEKIGESWQKVPLSQFGIVLAMGTAIIGSLFSSDAWNNVTFIAGEIKQPHRNIPISLLLGTCIVTLVYVAANFAYLCLLPILGNPEGTEALSQGIMFAGNGTDRVGTAAASVLFGNTSGYIMAALIVVSTFGCNNGLILSGARAYYAMAKDGLFIKQAAHLNKHHVPAKALWLQAAWACMLCLSGTYGDLLDYCTFVSLVFYGITIAGIFKLRRTAPHLERPYKVPLYPFLPLFYILAAAVICGVLLYTKTQNTLAGLAIVALGLPVYFVFNKAKKS